MGAKGAFAPCFFCLPFFENLTSVKMPIMGFTHYLLNLVDLVGKFGIEFKEICFLFKRLILFL